MLQALAGRGQAWVGRSQVLRGGGFGGAGGGLSCFRRGLGEGASFPRGGSAAPRLRVTRCPRRRAEPSMPGAALPGWRAPNITYWTMLEASHPPRRACRLSAEAIAWLVGLAGHQD